MQASLTIGDFSRATQLSIKTLRNYHRQGLLEPAEIDRSSGYRRYGVDQIPTAQVIRRFRALDMPLADIRAVLLAPDIAVRNDLIAAHLRRLEEELERTGSAVRSLRDLLEHPVAAGAVTHRTVAAQRALAITEVLDIRDAAAWYQGALAELHAVVDGQALLRSGTPGGLFSNELFHDERGRATIFIPCSGEPRAAGRALPVDIPAAELATTVHPGGHAGIDREYGILATYVAEHALAVDGPIREYYLVGAHDTAEQSAWRTEVGWPIFATGSPGR